MRERAPDPVRTLARNDRAGIPTDTVCLTASPQLRAFARDIEALAQKIAGRGADAVTLEIARSVARAEFELAQIRRVRVALIARMSEFGEFEVRRIST